MSNIYESLTNSGYIAEQSLKERSNISVSEKGKTYLLHLEKQLSSAVFSVDGYIIKEGNKCDKLVLLNVEKDEDNDHWNEVFVELKGTDVSHAILQLETTIKNTIFNCNSIKKIYARIVASSFPSNNSDPTFEKARQKFAKEYKCELKRLKSKQPDKLF